MRIHAKTAWVNGRDLIRDVVLDVSDGKIRSITTHHTTDSCDAVADFLVPGFINAHCHLEYTALSGCLPRGDVPFGQWLDAIVAARESVTEQQFQQGITVGTQALLAGGCTTVFDSTTLGNNAYLTESRLRHFILHEVLGLTDQRAKEQLKRVLPQLADRPQSASDRLLGVGINPHALYSVGTMLRMQLREILTKQPELICAWHLSETLDEEQLLRTNSGSIADFLDRLGLEYNAPLVAATSARSAATEVLAHEQLLDRCDVAFHLNFAGAEDQRFFRAPRAVVHCPTTHAYFSRNGFPAADFIRQGANLCLGTDSLGSSDTLSMLGVLQKAVEEFPTLSGPQLLDMATRNPARSRVLAGANPPLGTLAPGFAADFVDLRCSIDPAASVREMLYAVSTAVDAVWIAGERVFAAREADARA